MKSAADTILLTGEHLPVIGDAHPLRIRYQKVLLWATGLACFFHLAGFGGWLIGRNYHRGDEHAPTARLVKFVDLGVPPSLTNRDVSTQVNISNQVAPPSIGVPEPVPDFQAPNLTMASQEEMSQALQPTDLSQLGNGGGDSLVVSLDNDKDHSPSPDEFVAVEEMPVLISIPAPSYPEMARQAEVEGTVMVRVLISKDGKVKDAIIPQGQGVTMLNDAAIEAARKAIFKPALQQHRPVEVWVQIPMRFTLH